MQTVMSVWKATILTYFYPEVSVERMSSYRKRAITKFYYKDVRQLLFRTPLYKVEIHGVTEATFYKYNKDGTLNTVPQKNITCDAHSSFYTMFNPEIDFAKVFETHTPLKIEYHDASYSLDYDRRELNNFFEMIDIECAQVVVVYCIAIGQVPVTISHAEDYGC